MLIMDYSLTFYELEVTTGIEYNDELEEEFETTVKVPVNWDDLIDYVLDNDLMNDELEARENLRHAHHLAEKTGEIKDFMKLWNKYVDQDTEYSIIEAYLLDDHPHIYDSLPNMR